MEVLEVSLMAFFSAISLFIIAKILGHKQMSQLDFFDYITGITIGSIAAELATELEDPLQPLIAMLVYGIVSYAISTATRKFPSTRRYFNGTPTILFNDGKLFRKNMKKAKLELSEFMVLCRQSGYFDLGEIQTAIFEYNGRLTVLPKSTKRPVQPADSGLTPKQEHILTEIIMDGRVMKENLSRMDLSEKWLEAQLRVKGYQSAREIYLGLCDEDRNLTLYKS